MRPTYLVRGALGAAALLGAVVVAPGALGPHVGMRPVSASTVVAGTGVGLPVAGAQGLTRYVNPLAGSLGPGFPFVGAALPFAMATPGPATMLPTGPDPVNYVGYGYQDPLISGFALTHFDGAGVHIAGDLPIMATTGSVSSSSPMMFASSFSHASETSHPGYYGVTLSKYDIRAELTATTRVGVMRFVYPAGQGANVLFDTSQNNVGLNLASVAITGENTVSGWMKATTSGNYRVYFSASFDRDFGSFGTWDGAGLDPGSASSTSSSTGAWVSFPASSGPQTVTVRVGLSYTSATGAADNLAVEAPPSLSFDAIRAAATQTWNEHLRDVVVTGGSTATTETFYTNLYRALLMPSVLNDDDGSYLGLDDQVHQVPVGHEHYTNLSLWDIYRSQVPLLDLVEPAVAQDIATSLLADYDQNGEKFPRWVYSNLDYGTMGGDSAIEVLATDLADGVLSGQEAGTAYADLVHAATTPLAGSGHLGVYLDNGYIPYAGTDNRPSSETLSYAIGYGALAQVAQTYGTPAQVEQFSGLGGYWKNLFDPSDRFLRPRNSDGSWANPTSVGPESIFSPDSQDGWQEGTGWQYLWSVPQDVAGLTQAIGGRDATLSRLDLFFSTALQTGTAPLPVAQVYDNEGGIYYVGDQYTASNEPDLWSPYYYDWLGQPWKTAKVVHSEMQTYNASPDGLPGNDDAGEMSAWYVLSALGIYQVTPGTPSWELTTPTFPLETIRLGSQGSFVISAPETSPVAQYVQSARLDGLPLSRTWISAGELAPGGTLCFGVGPVPSASWASGPGAAPPSMSS